MKSICCRSLIIEVRSVFWATVSESSIWKQIDKLLEESING